MKLLPTILLLCGGFLLLCGQLSEAQDAASLERANGLLKAAPIVDGHNDLPWVIREKFGNDVEGYDISVVAKFDTDIPRLRTGGVGAQFWSVWVPSSLGPFESMRAQLEQIDIARRMIDTYPDDLMMANSVADIEEALEQSKIASMLGMEGGHTIGNSLGALRAYYDLGVRYMTLTHFNGHDWADSATDEVRHEGLTEFGREVVREMNRLGMLVDLSHVSPATMHDSLDVTEAPVIFSHSSAKALTAHARNVPDDVLKRMKANDGVVMVTFIPSFVNDERRVWEVKESKAVEQAQAMAERLAAVDLGVTKKAGESGTLYGSVTSAEIAELLEAKGVQVDRRKLVLNAPIKSVGTHEIAIRLHRKVKATITIVVLSDRVHEPLVESDNAPQDDEPDYDRDSE